MDKPFAITLDPATLSLVTAAMDAALWHIKPQSTL
jgi:hypothetical protein